MIHIDGTNCKHPRKSMPTRSSIARYWKDKTHEVFGYLMDWGEPSCWACGMWVGELDIDLTNLKGDAIFKSWDSHNYLERCHVIAKAQEGCNCEANLVLLCKKCHKDSPDTKNPNLFVTWVKNRKSCFHHAKIEVNEAIEDLGYEGEDDDYKIFFSKEFVPYLFENAVIVGGKISTSSKIACLIEYKKLLAKKNRCD